MKTGKILAAEAFGTLILMLGGPGAAVLAGGTIGTLGVALAFGLALLVAVATVGPVSGAHVNPAVTLGLVMMRKVERHLVPAYVIGQVVGALLGGAVVLAIAKGRQGGFNAMASNFATNMYGNDNGFYDFWAVAVAEIFLTGLLVFVVLATASRRVPPSLGALTVGLAYGLIHLVAIPVDNTGVNPVRSLGMAIFTAGDGDALTQLWAFIVLPLIGAMAGVLAWVAVDDATLEDTVFGDTPLAEARDALARAGDVVERAADDLGDRLS
jgi:aquaporin Z